MSVHQTFVAGAVLFFTQKRAAAVQQIRTQLGIEFRVRLDAKNMLPHGERCNGAKRTAGYQLRAWWKRVHLVLVACQQ